MAELTLKNVSKSYRKRNQVVRAVKAFNLSCRDGEFVALLGPSGCGKSTTLRMIAGLEKITSGEIWIGGKKVNDLPPKKRGIGLSFENYALYPPLSVYDNIAFNLRAQGKTEEEIRREVDRLHNEIRCTTVIVTHDQSEAMALADRIAVMNEGELQQFGTPIEIFRHPVNQFVAGFIGEPPMNLFTVRVVKEEEAPVFKIEGGGESFAVPDRLRPVGRHALPVRHSTDGCPGGFPGGWRGVGDPGHRV